jgi:hypothetical protein
MTSARYHRRRTSDLQAHSPEGTLRSIPYQSGAPTSQDSRSATLRGQFARAGPWTHRMFMMLFLGCATAFGKHAGVRVQTDRPREQMSEADGKHARAAAGIQKPAVPIQTRLLRQDGLEFR